MKLNFSLHFRTFMTGAIIFLSLVILLISLPEGEYSIFEDILDEESGFLYVVIFFLSHLFFLWNRDDVGDYIESVSTSYLFNQTFG